MTLMKFKHWFLFLWLQKVIKKKWDEIVILTRGPFIINTA
jgi:hypothetical protein